MLSKTVNPVITNVKASFCPVCGFISQDVAWSQHPEDSVSGGGQSVLFPLTSARTESCVAASL